MDSRMDLEHGSGRTGKRINLRTWTDIGSRSNGERGGNRCGKTGKGGNLEAGELEREETWKQQRWRPCPFGEI